MMKKKQRHFIYDIIISTLAVIAAILILIDASEHLNDWQLLLNRCIWIIFIVDFITRYIKASDKKRYFIQNFGDFFALIPLHGLLPCCPLPQADLVLRMLNLLRIFAFLRRPLKKATRFLNTNGFKYILFVTALTILTSGILIHYAEGMSIEDGIWWAFVTATTVGYGDISPHSFYGRMIAMVLMLLGIGLIGSITSTLTSYFLQSPSKSVKDNTLDMIQEQISHFDELSEEDIEEICRILKAIKQKKK
ncbi:MAG: ion channel [Eubacteriales bacterium]|nr:ion channel [Eubacteriales bacterium]